MWWKTEDEMQIDIQPRGEQDRHIACPMCECGPRVGQSDDKRVMIVHRTFDGAAGFVMVGSDQWAMGSERRAA